MRVVHLQKFAGMGGSERHLLELLPAMRKQDIDTWMVLLRAADPIDFTEPLRGDGVSTREINAGSDVNPLLLAKLVQALRQVSPELVHTHLIHADVYGQLAARLTHTPAVMTLHSAIFEFWSAGARSLMRAAAGQAQRVIAISQNVARAVERAALAPKEKVVVIPYGIDADGWLFEEQDRARARRRFGWDPGDVVVGVAARLIPLKGHDYLIDAFSEAAPSMHQARLVIAGAGPLQRDLEERGRSKDCQIEFLGHVSDVKSFMNACDIVVFPTLRGLGEGFGLAALEAMAAGRVTIATNVDSLPELVEPGDVSGLSEVLVQLAGDPARREELGHAARRVAITRFTRESMVQRTIEVYRHVLERAS